MNWHRLFGLLLTDFFAGSPFEVELEKDLSIKKQLLDVVILRRRRGRLTRPLPDGFDDLANHNLITFKSHHEALDDWALKELTGHYVNYRKQTSPNMQSLLPEDEFRLYAVCSRFPHNLAGLVELKRLQNGVFDCRRGTDSIRVVVVHELPLTENNALLHLLAAAPAQVNFGVANYQRHSEDISSLLTTLFEGYEREGIIMPYTMEDFRRDFTKEHLKELTPKERIEGLSPEERIEGLSPQELLKTLSPDQRLQGLSPGEIEELFKRHRSTESPQKRKKKKQ